MQALLSITDHTRDNIGGRKTLTPTESDEALEATRLFAVAQGDITQYIEEKCGLARAMAVLKWEMEHDHSKVIATVDQIHPAIAKYR